LRKGFAHYLVDRRFLGLPSAREDADAFQNIREVIGGLDLRHLLINTFELDDLLAGMASMLSLQVGETMSYAQIQADAALQLVQLSMQAEVDRAAASQREEASRSEANRLREVNTAILEAASTDGLTKIANRAAFDKRLAEELDQALSGRHPLSLILMDVDYFKQFNDQNGHQAGDEVLRRIASSLNSVAHSLGFVARYGGEEFAVIVGNKTGEEIQTLADQIRSTIEASVVPYQGTEFHVTASLGAVVVEPAQSPITCEELISDADKWLYQAKRNGRNRVEMPDQSTCST